MFVVGGEIVKDNTLTFVDTIFVFEEGEWKQVACMKIPRANHGVSKITILQKNIDKYCT